MQRPDHNRRPPSFSFVVGTLVSVDTIPMPRLQGPRPVGTTWCLLALSKCPITRIASHTILAPAAPAHAYFSITVHALLSFSFVVGTLVSVDTIPMPRLQGPRPVGTTWCLLALSKCPITHYLAYDLAPVSDRRSPVVRFDERLALVSPPIIVSLPDVDARQTR